MNNNDEFGKVVKSVYATVISLPAYHNADHNADHNMGQTSDATSTGTFWSVTRGYLWTGFDPFWFSNFFEENCCFEM